MISAHDAKANAMTALRDVLGYIENGGGTTVRIYQDDATRNWTVAVGPSGAQSKYYHGESLLEAIHAAHKEHHEFVEPF